MTAAISTWVAGAAVVSSLYGAYENSKNQEDMMNSQLGAQNADMAFRRQMYLDEKNFSDPLRKELKGLALQEGPLDYGPMKSQIESDYGQAGRQMETAMAQRGLTGSGIDAGMTRGMLLSKAGDLSKAYSQGLINKRQLALSLLGHDGRLQAGGLVAQGGQNQANLYGNYAQQYGQAAQAGYGAASDALMNGLYLLGTKGQTPGTQTPGPDGMMPNGSMPYTVNQAYNPNTGQIENVGSRTVTW